MSKNWSATAPTGLYIKWENGEFEADLATSSAIARSVANGDQVSLTATGPVLTVTEQDELALSVAVINFWQFLLTDAQFARMAWENQPELTAENNDSKVVY